MNFNFKKLFLLLLILVASNTQSGWGWSHMSTGSKATVGCVAIGLVAAAGWWAYQKYMGSRPANKAAKPDDSVKPVNDKSVTQVQAVTEKTLNSGLPCSQDHNTQDGSVASEEDKKRELKARMARVAAGGIKGMGIQPK